MKQRMSPAALILLSACFGLHVKTAEADNVTITTGGRVTVELITADALYRNTMSVIAPAVKRAANPGCKLEPAVGLDGEHVISEKVSQHGCRVDLDSDPVTPGIQGFAANTTFKFGMCAQLDEDPECEYVWSSVPSENVNDGREHLRQTPLSTNAIQLAWEDESGLGDQDYNDLVAVLRVQADADGDGLWDDWELSGIDLNGDGVTDYNLPALGVDWQRKDLFVEIDYFDCGVPGGDCGSGNVPNHASHRPKQAAVDALVAAFANSPVTNPNGSAGITLHVDVGNAIAHQELLSLACGGVGDTAVFDALKADPANFGPNNPRRFTHRYGIMGHRDPTGDWTGCGETPGDDFTTTLGGTNGGGAGGGRHTECIWANSDNVLNTTALAGDDISTGFSILAGPNLICETTAHAEDWQKVAVGTQPPPDLDADGLDDRYVGTVQEQAGTIMHEFGHTLGLNHGGTDKDNNKPNYLSLMNYAIGNGIQSIDPDGQPIDPDGAGPLTGRVDYSRQALPSLNENALLENAGIGDGGDSAPYRCPNGDRRLGAGNRPIDWNCNGLPDVLAVFVDVSGDGTFGTLTGANDWPNIVYAFQNTGNFEAGDHSTTVDLEEPEGNAYLETPVAIAIDVLPSINLEGRGVIPVVICNGGPIVAPNGFENAGSNVIIEGVRFGPNGAGPAHGGHNTDSPNCLVDAEGPDLLVHIPVQDTGLRPGDREACVSALLTDGRTAFGCDAVNLVPPRGRGRSAR